MTDTTPTPPEKRKPLPRTPKARVNGRTAHEMVTELYESGLSETKIAIRCEMSQIQINRIRHQPDGDTMHQNWLRIFRAWRDWKLEQAKAAAEPAKQ